MSCPDTESASKQQPVLLQVQLPPTFFDPYALEKHVAAILIQPVTHREDSVFLHPSPTEISSRRETVMNQPTNKHLHLIWDLHAPNFVPPEIRRDLAPILSP